MAQTAQQGRPMPQGGGNAPIPGFHATDEIALLLAERGIEAPSALSLIRRRIPDVRLELTEEDLSDTVDVVCFVDTMPWTNERPLNQGETATVPRKVAAMMVERHQVTIVSKG